MRTLLTRWIVTSFAILMVPHLIHGIAVESLGAALACAAVLSILNLVVRPVLVFLTFPFTLLSLGLFLLVINALLFYWAGALVAGVHVSSFGTAFLAALIVSIVSWILNAGSGRGQRNIVVHRWERKPPSRRRVVDLN